MKDLLIRFGAVPEAPEQVTDQEVVDAIRSVPAHYSANLIVDLYGTCVMEPSIWGAPFASGGAYAAASGAALVGSSVDMIHANTACQVVIQGQSFSGELKIQIQTSDTDVSGSYTDPTSGLPQLPSVFQSGSILWINSGSLSGGIFGAFTSGQSVSSGFIATAYFQRPMRFVRAIALTNTVSGAQYAGPLSVGFLSQLKTTGSGGGSSQSPSTSGAFTVNV